MSDARRVGIRGEMSRLYDVFVDWPGRLARELPGLERELAAVGARRVLDLGCGTGQHVAALLERGYDARGADASEEMLARAEGLLGARERLHLWRMGEEPPAALLAAPFDALISLGNVWPQLASEAEARAAAAACLRLLRPGGLLLLAFKAFGVRAEGRQPYLPLLRRRHEGRTLWFVRFVDLEIPPGPDGLRLCDLHMTVVAGEAGEEGQAALHHGATRVRAWGLSELVPWFAGRGFAEVRLGGSLAEAGAAASGEDVVLVARRPPDR